MSNIQEIYQQSLQQAGRDHLVGVRTGNREEGYWKLKFVNGKNPIPKLKLVLSWKFGAQVISMTDADVLKYIISEYKKYNYYSFLGMKYGEFEC